MDKEFPKTALITGASAGIGKALAQLHASRGGNLVLVARREDRLLDLKKELQEKYTVDVHVIAKDLSQQHAPQEIYQELKKRELTVDYLINNAGFSQQGYYHEIDWQVSESIIMVNVMAVASLCRLLLPDMIARNQGRILNIASSAAFAPGGPMLTVYFASKAFLVSFSQGLAGELSDTEVTVTAVCPGATATEFEKVSGLDQTNLFASEKVFEADEVALDAYEAMLKGDLLKLTALTRTNKFILKNMNLFPAKAILQQIKNRQIVRD
jgi:short-subunit dehydrogenase